MTESADTLTPQPPRRNFLIEFWSVAIGGIVTLVPFLAGLAALLDPLRRRARREGGQFIRVATLDAVPDDGVPRQFPVVSDMTDAWTYSPNERIGAVYLRRKPGEKEVHALNVVCPHAGCFVGFDAGRNVFQCPCHTSSFSLEGDIIRPSPSPRNMDELQTRVTGEGAVEVAFVNYYPGKHEQIEKR